MTNEVRYARCETPKPYWESSKNVATRKFTMDATQGNVNGIDHWRAT